MPSMKNSISDSIDLVIPDLQLDFDCFVCVLFLFFLYLFISQSCYIYSCSLFYIPINHRNSFLCLFQIRLASNKITMGEKNLLELLTIDFIWIMFSYFLEYVFWSIHIKRFVRDLMQARRNLCRLSDNKLGAIYEEFNLRFYRSCDSWFTAWFWLFCVIYSCFS